MLISETFCPFRFYQSLGKRYVIFLLKLPNLIKLLESDGAGRGSTDARLGARAFQITKIA